MPTYKNKITVRLENLADVYDEKATTQRVALKWLLGKMWESANLANPVMLHKLDIKEKSLTGNMDLKEMLDRKIKWKTVDDSKSTFGKISHKFDGEYVDLEPQRIRVFEVTFTPDEKTADMETFLQ